MTERVAMIVNPTKFSDTAELTAAAQAHADRAGYQLDWYETTPSDAGRDVTASALAAGCTLVVACGGDGTITACADALVSAQSPARLAVIPAGTGNLFARNLNVPLGLAPALEVAFGAGTRRIDVLQSSDERFLVMAGLGLDAALIRDTSDSLKRRIGWPAYLGGLTRAVRKTKKARFTVRLDNQPVIRIRSVGVLVGNVGSLQGGIELLAAATPDDGLLDVIVLAPRTLGHWLVLAVRTLTGRVEKSGATVLAQGRRVTITSDRPMPMEFDGEFVRDGCRLEVTVLAGALTVCSPSSEAIGTA